MTIDPADAVGHAEYEGKTYYFCSDSCLTQFRADPAQFVEPGRILRLHAWLSEAACTHVAMGSTGVYWQPVFNLLEILRKADACTRSGELGALLRKEGLYSSHVVTWRRQRAHGLTPKTRGRKKTAADPRVKKLEQENRRLTLRLQQAEAVIGRSVPTAGACLEGRDASGKGIHCWPQGGRVIVGSLGQTT